MSRGDKKRGQRNNKQKQGKRKLKYIEEKLKGNWSTDMR